MAINLYIVNTVVISKLDYFFMELTQTSEVSCPVQGTTLCLYLLLNMLIRYPTLIPRGTMSILLFSTIKINLHLNNS